MILLAARLTAQEVIIKGTAVSYEGENISLNTYGDLITMNRKEIAGSVVDKSSAFSFRMKLGEPAYVFFQVLNIRCGLLVQPGNTYEVLIPTKDSVYHGLRELEYSVYPIDVLCEIRKGKDDLNLRMRKFNALFNGFLLDHQEQLARPRNKDLVAKITQMVKDSFATETNPYLKASMEYRLATFEQMQFVSSREELAQRYLVKRPVLFYNTDYMEFVSQYFYRYANRPFFYNKTEHIRDQIENKESYFGLVTLFQQDPVLKKNDTLREIVILCTLQDYFQDGLFQPKPILNIIHFVSLKGLCPQTRKIAQNIYDNLTRMRTMSKSPELAVCDNSGKKYRIEDSKGKYVYLCFWTSWSVPCLEELKMMPLLEKKYGERVDFICINADRKGENFIAALKEYDLEGRQYYAGKDQKLLEAWKIVSYPTFVLIDPAQNVLQYPARKPSEEIEDYILMYLLKEDPKKWDPYKKKDGFRY